MQEEDLFMKAFNTGVNHGYFGIGYVSGYLEAQGLLKHIEEIAIPLFRKIIYETPANPLEHPELLASSKRLSKDYIEKWKMYNELFEKV